MQMAEDIVSLCKCEIKTFKQNLPKLTETDVNVVVQKTGRNARVCIKFCNKDYAQKYLKGTSIILVSASNTKKDLLFLKQFLSSQMHLCNILFLEEKSA